MDEQNVNERMGVSSQEHVECGCDDDMPIDDSACRVKKIAALVVGAIIVLALFAGILMRCDAVLTDVKAMRDQVIAAQSKTDATVSEVAAVLQKVQASLAAIEAKIGDDSATTKNVSAALDEMRTLYKQTNASLNQALQSKDILLREALNKLGIATPSVQPEEPTPEPAGK